MLDELTSEILTDIEKEKVEKFAEDKATLQAVKKFILAVAYDHGVPQKGKDHKPTKNFALKMAFGAIGALSNPTGNMPRSDEELGQNIRALASAVQLVETGFNELQEFKKVEPLKEEKDNPAE